MDPKEIKKLVYEIAIDQRISETGSIRYILQLFMSNVNTEGYSLSDSKILVNKI